MHSPEMKNKSRGIGKDINSARDMKVPASRTEMSTVVERKKIDRTNSQSFEFVREKVPKSHIVIDLCDSDDDDSQLPKYLVEMPSSFKSAVASKAKTTVSQCLHRSPPAYNDQSSNFNDHYLIPRYFQTNLPPISLSYEEILPPCDKKIVKVEWNDDTWIPEPHEIGAIKLLEKHGIFGNEAVIGIRNANLNIPKHCRNKRKRHDVENEIICNAARKYIMEQRKQLCEAKEMDLIRLSRDEDIGHSESVLKEAEKKFLKEGNVLEASRFKNSTLLAVQTSGGCESLRKLLSKMENKDYISIEGLKTFREIAIQLLIIEEKTKKWYREVLPAICEYFRRLANRIDSSCAASNSPETFDEIKICSMALIHEIERLEIILYRFPDASMDVPPEFRECMPSLSLENDGIEEVRANPSQKRKCTKPVEIIEID